MGIADVMKELDEPISKIENGFITSVLHKKVMSMQISIMLMNLNGILLSVLYVKLMPNSVVR